jgi:hypothetical protein
MNTHDAMSTSNLPNIKIFHNVGIFVQFLLSSTNPNRLPKT